jgi:HEAT repeat protein
MNGFTLKRALCGWSLTLWLAVGFATAQTGTPQSPDDPLEEKTQRAVRNWMKELTDKDTFSRRFAAGQLSVLGAAAQPALPLLVKTLDDPDGDVRIEAAAALCRLNHETRRATALLLDALQDKKHQDTITWHVRNRRLALDESSIPRLRAALAAPNPGVRVTAAWALGGIGPGAREALPALRKLLNDVDPQLRVAVAFAVCRLGDEKAGLAVLIAAVQNRRHAEQAAAAGALNWLGAEGRNAVPALIALLKEEEYDTRAAACHALGGIGPAASAAVPSLVKALVAPPVRPPDNKARPLHDDPAKALAGIGTDAVPALIPLLKYPEDNGPIDSVRRRARWALILIDKDAVPALAVAWKSDDKLLRNEALNVLRNLGKSAAPVFLEHLNDPKYRSAAVAALRKTNWLPPSAVAPLARLLSDPDLEVRSGAAQALGSIDHVELIVQPQLPASPARRQAALALEPHLNDKNADVRFWVLVGLDNLGQEGIPVWVGALKHPDAATRRSAARVFSRNAVPLRSADAVPALLAAVDDGDAEVSRSARAALGQPLGPEFVAGLVKVLEDAKAGHRVRAAEFLGAGGAAAREAVPRLTPLLKDPDPQVRAAVGQALKRLAVKGG